MDETALVADLVYGGTLVIGAAVLFIMMVLLVAMTLLAGVAGSLMSVARRARRLLPHRAERQTPVEEAASSQGRSTAALVAKADAILAALRAETAEPATIADLEEPRWGAEPIRGATGAKTKTKTMTETETETACAVGATAAAEEPSARGLVLTARPPSRLHHSPEARPRPAPQVGPGVSVVDVLLMPAQTPSLSEAWPGPSRAPRDERASGSPTLSPRRTRSPHLDGSQVGREAFRPLRR